MPFSIPTFYAIHSVMTKNLFQRMNFVKTFFKIRLTVITLFIVDNSKNNVSLSLDDKSLNDIFVSVR